MTNNEDINIYIYIYTYIYISPVISDSENSYSISSAPSAVAHTTYYNLFIKSGKIATIADSTPTYQHQVMIYTLHCSSSKINFVARWWLENPILWMKYIVWKNKSSYQKTILLREEQHNNEKILNTILDHNTSLLKHNDTFH